MVALEEALSAAGVPQYDTPTSAVRAYLQLVHYARNQASLSETPDSRPLRTHDTARAGAIIDEALAAAEGADARAQLGELETKALLAAYGVPVVESVRVTTHADALAAAAMLGYPLAVKLLSPEVSHKSDIGGVQLDIEDDAQLAAALKRIDDNLRRHRPQARLAGYTLQRMAARDGAYELLLGLTTDPVFGPAIVFGAGGTAVEVLRDTAVALPPLNSALARDLVARTDIARLLQGYRDRPPAALDALTDALLALSQLVIDHPRLVELDINPLLCDARGVLALDARATVAAQPVGRLAIRPYPGELETRVTLEDGEVVTVRPIRPEDEPMHRAFLERVSPEDLRFRFFRVTNRFSHEFLAGFTQIDYDREMALIATRPGADGQPETLGVVRAVSDADNDQAEFAILVRTDCKGRGLGEALMHTIIDYQARRGTRLLFGEVLIHNHAMLGLCKSLGFRVDPGEPDEVVRVELPLRAASP